MDRVKKSQYLSALEAIHRLGILHGDIREQNFIATESHVYIIDFGFSRKASMFELHNEYNQFREALDYRPVRSLNYIDQHSEHLPLTNR
jgi:serine/threonine protein kinase